MIPATGRASVGYLVRHPWQLALALIGIGIGVAVMVAVDLANQGSRKAFIASMDAVNGDATHQIVAGPGGVDESFYVALRVEAGIRSIAPVVSGYVRVADRRMQLLGVDVFAEREFRSYSAPVGFTSDSSGATGRGGESIITGFLAADGQVLMAASIASDLALAVGEEFDLFANGKQFTAELAGLPNGNAQESVLGQPAEILIADISVAQHWFNMPGKLSRIDVKIAPGDDVTVANIRALLPPGVELLTAAGRTQTTADMSDAFMTNLFAMSLLALLVGIFLIYNSVAFTVLQRRNLIGVLRALGVTRSQILNLILIEALVIGIVGAVIGVIVGVWLGEKLLLLVARTISDHYFAVNVANVAIDSFSLAKGFVAGVGATVLAALMPALEAASYQPRLALSRSMLESRTGDLLPKLGMIGMLTMLLSIVLLWASGDHLGLGLSALFLLILGFAFCIPWFVSRASSILQPLAGHIGGVAGRLAVSSIGKNLSRTGVAVVALSIAVSATIGVSVMVESFRLSVGDWLTTTLQSDIYVGVPGGSLDAELINDLVNSPGIREYSTSRRAWLENAQGRAQIIALQMASGSYDGTRLRGVDTELAWKKFDAGQGVFVSDAYAYRTGLSPGDSLQLNTASGRIDIEIAAVFQSYDSNNGAVLMSRKTYDRYFDDSAVDSIGIYLESDTDVQAVMDRLRSISAGRQSLLMNSNARIREISLEIFDRTFVVTNVLYWLAVGVAVIGILGAMLALQLERGREYGLLRAIGVTPNQMRVLVGAQTGCIGLFSGIAAIPLGLMMAWILIDVINRRAFGWEIDFTVAPGVLLSALVLAIGAGLLAGIYPAWNASRTQPAIAMRAE